MTDAFTPFVAGDIQTSISARFEEQVRRSPDRLAVKARHTSFTYAELNASANRIAYAVLDAKGEGQERVALLLGQGVMLIAAILGVLKAGKIYVPLDARHPRLRLTQMIEDADPSIILCERAYRELAEASCRSTTTIFEVESLDTSRTMDPVLRLAPETLAYIYYTSGSTGLPKGVVDSHRNVLHNVMRYVNGLRISPADRLSLVQSCSFSACVSTQFSALLTGAALFPFDLHEEGPRQLGNWVRAERITMFHSVPTLFRVLVEAAGQVPDLRLVRLEGDRASWSDVALFQTACRPGSQLVNGLGTTETGIVRRYFVDHHTAVETGPLPLGYPVEGMDLIIERDGREVDAGEVGQIAIRSEYLAVGYWRRPDLNGQVFHLDGGRRTFTTADLGSLRADGCLDYVGRKDFHARIRGHHVEVGAVESALAALGDFSQVVVVTFDDPGAEPRLVAYLVPSSGSPPSASDIRRALERTLPATSIPSAFVMLAELPLTANGKVDLRSLPPPSRCRPRLDNEFVAPRSSLEADIARLWAVLLAIDEVGVTDRFLDLGGDSLLAARVILRLRSQWGVDVPLRMMFDSLTVAELARVVDRERQLPEDISSPVAIGRRPVGTHLPLSSSQRRIWLLNQLDPGEPVYNEPTAVRLRGTLDPSALQRAFQDVVDRHDALRLAIHCDDDGVPEQILYDREPFAIEIVDLRGFTPASREVELSHLLRDRARQPFDLVRGPLIRAGLFSLTDDEHVLVVVIHHIVCDAWSLGQLWRDLSSSYTSFVSQRPSRVAPLRISYADYVEWEQRRVDARRDSEHIAYWVHLLKDAPSVPPLRTGRDAPAGQSTRGGFYRTTLTGDSVRRCEAFGVSQGATTFMVLLAALKVAVARQHGCRDVVIGSPVAGRAHEDAEPLIGCFVNMIALRTDLSGQPSFRDVVRRVRDVALDAFSHQDVPFDLVVGSLPGRGPLGRPVFSIAFSLENVPWRADGFVGLHASDVEVSTGCTQIDLGFSVRPTDTGLRVLVEYNEGTFGGDTVRQLVDAWTTLLDSALTAPDVPLFEPPTQSFSLEQTLAAWWAEELHVSDVDPDDHFVDLGGHSINVIRLISRMRDRLGVAVTFQEFFEAATVANVARLLAARPRHPEPIAEQPLKSLASPGEVSLTDGQQQIFAAAEINPELPIYNEPFTIRFNQSIDAVALERALNALIEHHDILRTAFVTGEAGPTQVVHAHASLRLQVVDVTEDSEGEAVVRDMATATARQLFRLDQPPLLRAMLTRTRGDERLYVTAHHLIIDAFGLYYVFLPELAKAYDRSVRGLPPDGERQVVASSPSRLRQQYETGLALAPAHLDHWREELAEAPPLDLPTDFLRPAVASGRGAYRSFGVPVQRVVTLTAVGRSLGVTLFTVLGAAFATLLMRWTRQDDVVLATFDAGRDAHETQTLLGYFLRQLILRVDVRDDPPFTDFVTRFRESFLRARSHPDVPLSHVAEALHLTTSPRALTRVAFVMEPSLATGGDWTIDQHELQTGTSKFDLTLEVETRGQAIIGRFEYSTDLFEDATIGHLMDAWTELLGAIADNPHRPLSRLRLLSALQRQEVVGLNETRRPYARDSSIQDVFEQQVDSAPEALAVICGDTALSFRELNVRADHVASRLMELGVEIEQPVAISGARSVDFVVGVLAILKAGGAYVPIDPLYPAARQRWMLDDAGVSVVLGTSGEWHPTVIEGRTLVPLDESRLLNERVRMPTRGGRPTGLAYIMYTSGSSGEPKGVLVTHRGVVRLVRGNDFVPLDGTTRILLHSSTAFDASTFELWAPLLNGGTCALLPETDATLHDLEIALRQYCVSCLWLTSTLFNTIIDERPRMLGDLDHLVVGGEALSIAHVRRARAMFPRLRLLNGYGPTENTTFTSIHEIPPVVSPRTRSISIGRPIANTSMFVLGADAEPVPIGFPGELYIGGDGLARGYLNQPQLTSVRFIEHALGPNVDSRLYRSGDVVRRRSDGSLEFLGRLDGQLKIRGWRIEPGEVEAALLQHPSVRQCAVDASGTGVDRTLAAYIVSNGPAAPSAVDMRTFLRQQLPDHLIPTEWHTLEALPMTRSGKVDRRRLDAAKDAAGLASSDVRIAPSPGVETTVAQTFAQVLGLKAVGVESDFMALGGHSLKASILASKLRKALSIAIPLRAIFENPTPASLARWIVAHSGAPADLTRPAPDRHGLTRLRAGASSPTLFVAPSILGDVSGCENLWQILPGDFPVYEFQPTEADADIDSIEAIASRYVDTLAAFGPLEPVCIVGYSFGGLIAYEIARQWAASGRPLALVAIIDTGPAPANRTFADVLKTMPAIVRNLPMWLWEDVVQSPWTAVAADVRRKLQVIGRRIFSGRVLPGRPSAIHPGDVFDVRTMPAETRTAVQRRLEAANRYVPRSYPGRVLLFRARARPLFHALEPDLGWTQVAHGGVDIEVVPGNHATMMKEPHVRTVAACLARLLESAGAGEGLPDAGRIGPQR